MTVASQLVEHLYAFRRNFFLMTSISDEGSTSTALDIGSTEAIDQIIRPAKSCLTFQAVLQVVNRWVMGFLDHLTADSREPVFLNRRLRLQMFPITAAFSISLHLPISWRLVTYPSLCACHPGVPIYKHINWIGRDPSFLPYTLLGIPCDTFTECMVFWPALNVCQDHEHLVIKLSAVKIRVGILIEDYRLDSTLYSIRLRTIKNQNWVRQTGFDFPVYSYCFMHNGLAKL